MSQFITHITFKFNHHGNHTGYDMLTKYMNVNRVINRDSYNLQSDIFKHRGLSRINNLLVKISNNRFYNTLYKSMIKNAGIYHFLYPETVLSDFNYPVPSGVKIVSTFHQPPERYEKYLSKKENYRQLLNYRKTDYAIALGQGQVPFLRKLLQHDRIEVIPHGVDISFFKPGELIEPNEKLVLIVGNWMRDFVLARKLIEIFEERDKQVKFIVVTCESNRRYFEGLGNLSFFTGITDEELLRLYNNSLVLFLPLTGAIANNAILEALSCNLPVLVSDLPTLGYLAGTDGIYLFDNNNIDDTAAKLSQLLNESNQIKKKGLIRDLALKFRWENISDMVLNVYNRL